MSYKYALNIIADDLGYCEQRNRGILQLLSNGNITSSSLIVNALATEEATSIARQEGLRLALHLNLTEGKPICNSNDISSLLSDNGTFMGKHGFRQALSSGAISLEEVEKEVDTQIKQFIIYMGGPPYRLDGHQHIHVLPGIREVVARQMRKHSIWETRVPTELQLDQCNWIDADKNLFLSSVCEDAKAARSHFTTEGLRFSEFFVGLSVMGHDMSLQRIRRMLRLIKEQSRREQTCAGSCIEVEFMVHPGYKAIPGLGGFGTGPDDFALSDSREHEMNILASADFLKLLENEGFEVKTIDNAC